MVYEFAWRLFFSNDKHYNVFEQVFKILDNVYAVNYTLSKINLLKELNWMESKTLKFKPFKISISGNP